MPEGLGTFWKDAPLVALDLEGTGAQDRDDEAILEIAVVSITGGRPSLDDAYTTLINPGRPVPRRPWISPGLTDKALAEAPSLAEVEPEIAARLAGHVIVGHNVGVDWRLLHRRCPNIQPTGLIDTLRLARKARPKDKRKSLIALLDHYQLAEQVTQLAPKSQPHRALWDTIGVILLLTALIDDLPDVGVRTLRGFQHVAGIPHADEDRNEPEQLPLLDL
jgi:DNA polymerase-3 subunit epsilon/exodeoxyribonuclease X